MTIYLDHHATTPCAPSVIEAMLPYFGVHFGNAGSRQHTHGLRASAAVDLAREQVAALIGADPDAIVFTSGATESNNLAILGVADAHDGPGHIITCATEHKAVLDPVQHLVQARGWTSTVLQPDAQGLVSAAQVADALRDDTVMVSVMAANNEIGVLHPLADIAAVCRARGVLFHTDAAQITGKVPFHVGDVGADLVSLTAHKTCGPKGVGALWVRRGRPRVRIVPRQHGGGQERGLRSGTLPVPLLVGMGAAYALAGDDLVSGEVARQRALRDRLWAVLGALPGTHLHGSWIHRLPHNLNLRFDGVRSGDLVSAVRATVACSAGSACSTGNPRPSHVIKALGLSDADAFGAVRFGLGRTTTAEDVEQAALIVRDAVVALRAADPTASA